MRPASITVTTWLTRRRAIKHSGLRVAKDVRCSFVRLLTGKNHLRFSPVVFPFYMGLVMFGLIYGYLALSRWDVLLRSHFLMGLGLLWLVGYILLAQIYWFRIPLIGVSLATLLYLAGLVGIFAPNEDLSSTEGISRLENPKAQTAPGELHWRSHLRQLDTSNMAGCSQITCR